jgi:hypothetical protein
LQHKQGEDDLRASICISLAGLLAEEKFHGVKWRFEEDVIKELEEIRAGRRKDLNFFPSDLRAVALALFDDDPPIRFREARRGISYWRNDTNALLDEPRVWDCVERVAKVLVRRRYLSPHAVRELLGDTFSVGMRTSNGTRVVARPCSTSTPTSLLDAKALASPNFSTHASKKRRNPANPR